MAASIDHSSQSSSGSQAFTINNVGSILVCCFAGGAAVTSPQYGGVALTQVVAEDNTANSGGAASVWYLKNPPVGTANVTWGNGSVGIHEVVGVAGPGNSATGFSNAAGNPSVSITPLSTHGIYFTAAAANGSGAAATINPQNSQTQVLGTTSPPAASSAYLAFSVGTAQGLSYQPFNFTSGGNSSLAAAEFRQGQLFAINDTVVTVEAETAKRGATFKTTETITLVETKTFLRGAIFTITEHVTLIETYVEKLTWNLIQRVTSIWTDKTR